MHLVSPFAQRSLLALTDGLFAAESLRVGDRLSRSGGCAWPAFQAAAQRLMALSGGPGAFLQRAQTLQNRPGIQVLAASPISWRELVSFVACTILPVDFPQLSFSALEACDKQVAVHIRPLEPGAERVQEAVVLLAAGLLSGLRGMSAVVRAPLANVEAMADGYQVVLSSPDAPFRPRMPAQARLDEVFAELSADARARAHEVELGLAAAGRIARRRLASMTPEAACDELLGWLPESSAGAAALWLHEPGGHVRYAQRGDDDPFAVPVPLAVDEKPVGLLELSASGVSDFVVAASARIAAHLQPFARQASKRAAARRSWTDVEVAVARGAADGQSVKEIAHGLGVSSSTVAAVQTRLFRELGIQSRRSLVEIWADSDQRPSPNGPDDPPSPSSTRRVRRTRSEVFAVVEPASTASSGALTRPLAPFPPGVSATPGQIAQLHRLRLEALVHRRRELAWVREVLCSGLDEASAEISFVDRLRAE